MVTGGAGFLGSSLVERLLAEGHVVDVVDDLSGGSLANLGEARRSPAGRVRFHQLDVGAPEMTSLMQRTSPEVVYHLAGRGSREESVEDPLADARSHLLGALNVFEAARRAGATKVVYATDASALWAQNPALAPPWRESHPQEPVYPQGVARRAVAGYLHSYRELHSLEYSVLALTNVYGPRRRAGVVASFIDHLLAGQACTVFGDGRQTRDFLYVDDAVDALARCLDRGGGLLLNVGSGQETSIRDLYALLASCLGVDRPAMFSPPRPGDHRRQAVDPGRAHIHLGWRPWTPLVEGLRMTLEAARSLRPSNLS